jgi:hypothetical protein
MPTRAVGQSIVPAEKVAAVVEALYEEARESGVVKDSLMRRLVDLIAM